MSLITVLESVEWGYALGWGPKLAVGMGRAGEDDRREGAQRTLRQRGKDEQGNDGGWVVGDAEFGVSPETSARRFATTRRVVDQAANGALVAPPWCRASNGMPSRCR